MANTFIDNPQENQFSYYEIWAHPWVELTWKNFAQLDLVLVLLHKLYQIRGIESYPGQALPSHHLLVEISEYIEIERSISRTVSIRRGGRPDQDALKDPSAAGVISNPFAELAPLGSALVTLMQRRAD